MGWLQLPFAADDGGLEGGPIDTMLLVQEMGRGLVAAGYVESVVWAGSMLRMGSKGSLPQIFPSNKIFLILIV